MMLSKRLKSFRYAFAGLFDLFKSQPNALIHLAATGVVIAAGFYFQLSKIEWCIVSLTIALVFAVEAVNTALEYLTDLVSPGYHPLAGKTKDASAAAVLITAFGAVVVAVVIFLPKITALF